MNYPQWEIVLETPAEIGYNFRVVRDELFKRWIPQLDPETRWSLKIEPYEKPKSNDQMGWYRGLILKECLSVINASILEHGGEPLKEKGLDGFFSKEFLTVNKGTKFEGVLSKGALTAKQFSMFIEQITLHMAENYGYIVMPPDKNWKTKKGK